MKVKIKGTNKIEGTIKISGSKNTALPIICASLLTSEKVILENVPNILDVKNLIKIIKSLGCYIKYNEKKKTLIIHAKKFNTVIIKEEILQLRGAYYLMGAANARYGKCLTLMPGGCNFTNRPINLHINAFKSLGYSVLLNNQIIKIEKTFEENSFIIFEKKSLGATINTLLTIAKTNKEIKIINPSLEPEVLETIKFLRILGKKIEIKETQIITSGVIDNLSVKFKIISDRIEAGSYLLLASSIPNSNLTLLNAPVKYMESVFNVLKDIGQDVSIIDDKINIKSTNTIKPIDLIINEYPSFPTDLQQILSTILLFGNGKSTIKDNVYKDRISHIFELQKINGIIKYNKDIIEIYPSLLKNNNLTAQDLRCGFALLTASLHIDNETIIDNFEVVLRGYEDIFEKLNAINIKINII